jgi:hypothetical protein
MYRFAVALLAVAGLAPARPADPLAGGKEPTLAFAQDGKDLVVSTTIEVPDAPHVIWTHAELVMDHDVHLKGPRRPPRLARVNLSYRAIQCRDDPNVRMRRHQTKKVEVKWRLADHRKADVPYRVVEPFNPSAAELKELAPPLIKIAEATERRNRSPLATP